MFTLRGRADRIEELVGGGHAILDYKTGQVPTEQQVRIGVSPQLTLEAAILRGGGFRDIAADASVSELVYVALKGGEPAGEEKAIKFTEGDATFTPTGRWKNSDWSQSGSKTSNNRTCRWCCRCGRTATAPTTTSRASRSGRSEAPTRKTAWA